MASTYLTRTPSSAGNRAVWTWSAWIKINGQNGNEALFTAGGWSAGQDATGLVLYNGSIYTYWNNPSVPTTTAEVFRDPAAWYHVVLQANTSTLKVYINGSEVSSKSISGNGAINNTTANAIGRYSDNASGFFNGYMADIHFTDGTAYAPTTFGETDTSGVWVPKIDPTVTYGTNGFFLKFENSGAMGTDSSGNTNTFALGGGTLRQVPDTPTNVFPTLNPLVATSPKPTLSKGNLESTPSGNGNHTTGATQFMPENSGKWYAETVLTYVSNQSGAFTIQDPNNIKDSIASYSGQYSVLWQASGTDYYATHDGSSATNSTNATISVGDIFQIAYDSTNGKVWFGRNNTWITGNPSTDTTPTYSSITGDKVFTTTGYRVTSGSSYTAQLVNFGQDSSFGGNKTAQNNADANGKGDFYYAPPTGFLALCTDNLSSELTIPVNKGANNFNTVLWTGNGGTNNITGVGFQPDWLWIKGRSSATNHRLFDSTRGNTKYLASNNSDAEGTDTTALTSFDSDGFSLVSDGQVNGNGDTYVGWNWKAGTSAPSNTYAVKVVSDSGNKYRFDDYGTSAITLELQEGGTFTFDQSDSSNAGHPLRFSSTADGTHGGGSEYTTGVTTTGTPGQAGAKTVITVAGSAPTLYYYCSVHSGMGGQANTGSLFGFTNVKGTSQAVVSPNTTAGFSIVTYTGTGSNATVGHGLSATPTMMLIKNRSVTANWVVYHQSLGNGQAILLNSSGASFSAGDFNNTTPTSSVFSIGTSTSANANGNTYVVYCFADIEGYSKAGSYTGNGSTDGPFVYTGFRPAWIMRKCADAGEQWMIQDTTRTPNNQNDTYLYPSLSNAEATSSQLGFDILSNGFKMRHGDGATNGNGRTYIYMAFASNPFVTSTGKPVTAR